MQGGVLVRCAQKVTADQVDLSPPLPPFSLSLVSWEKPPRCALHCCTAAVNT